MVTNLIWTLPAAEDLENIFKFYKNNTSDERAHEIINLIFNATNLFNLSNISTKEIGQIEFDLRYRDKSYRYIVEGYFKIIYFVDENNIVITHVFDTRQNPDKKRR